MGENRFANFSYEELKYLEMVILSSTVYSPVKDMLLAEIHKIIFEKAQFRFMGGQLSNYSFGGY